MDPKYSSFSSSAAASTARTLSRPDPSSDRLQLFFEATSLAVGEEFFTKLVQYLAQAFRVRYAFVSERLEQDPSLVRFLAFWNDGALGDALCYDMTHAPCHS